jgi:hypothetical protein
MICSRFDLEKMGLLGHYVEDFPAIGIIDNSDACRSPSWHGAQTGYFQALWLGYHRCLAA